MLNKKKLHAMEVEERKAAREYRNMGFPGLAQEEERHANFFKMLRKKR